MGLNFEHVVQIVLLIIALRLLHMVTANDSCSEVRRHFAARRIGNMKMVPYNPYEAKDLQVCPNAGYTCCTRAMEARFQSAARKDVQKVLKYKTSGLKYNFRSISQKFQDDVEELFFDAKNSTREFLRRSLRRKTSNHVMKVAMAEVDRLFRSLKLRSKPDEIQSAFDRFANKMFIVMLNGSYNFSNSDNSYERCVGRQRRELHPFMDIPTLTAANLSVALELAQTFHQALAAGAEAVNVTEGAVLTKSCQRSLMKMQYCSHCFGLTLLKPCMGLCRNVLRGCLAGITEMDEYWNYYVSAMVDVTTRMRSMESKYNMEYAMQDFKNKFSASLPMIFENITTLQQSVEKKCRKNRTSKRSKRSADLQAEMPDDAKETDKGGGKRRNRQGRRQRTRAYLERTKELLRLNEEKILPGKSLLPPVRTRILPPHEVLYNPPPNRPRKATEQQVVETRNIGNLHSRIRRFITSLSNDYINFYRHLPDDMCTPKQDVTIEVVNHGRCWDGSNIVKQYSKDVVSVGYDKQATNPEVVVLKVENGVMGAIENLRTTAKMLFVAAGKEEIPAVLSRAPVFEPRKETQRPETTQDPQQWPCDDEDECAEIEGSGETGLPEIDVYPELPLPERKKKRPPLIAHEDQGRIKWRPENGPNRYNDTDVIRINDDVDIDVTIEKPSRNNRRNKGKNKHRENGRRKKGDPNPAPTERPPVVEATSPGSASCAEGSLLYLTLLTVLTRLFVSTLEGF